MPFCKKCDELYGTEHVCPPAWECRIAGTKYDGEWIETYARDVERAAARFCELYDRNGDYDIIQRGGDEIEVRKMGDEKITIVNVSAESVPHYFGSVARQP